jgi:thiosulfate/3-mercaptopyruvate sulfurtransferase
MEEVLISAQELDARLAAGAARGEAPLVLDVRWVLGDPHGHRHHLARRIPGSVYVDLNADLAAPGEPALGRHPLPSPEEFQATARRWGLRSGQGVVVLDDNGGLAAARAWWLLRWAGLEDVRLLDGGLRAWTEAGYAVHGEQDPVPTSEPGDVRLGSGRMPVVDIDAAAAFPGHGVLLDARAAERYRGETEPVDPRAGHVPGALNAPTGENLREDGHFKDADALRARFEALGAGPEAGTAGEVAVYCGSGVTAAHEILALALAGVPAALYPGSWSQWSNDARRPVATGAEA